MSNLHPVTTFRANWGTAKASSKTTQSAWYDSRRMIVLFSITMLCFLALFAMLLLLLRQAKAEGAREQLHRRAALAGSRRERWASSSPDLAGPQEDQKAPLPISSLVPGKQPDWRFMVRDDRHSTESETVDPRLAGSLPTQFAAAQLSAVASGQRKGVSQAAPRHGRFATAIANADLGDLRDPPAASQGNAARRA